MPPPGIKIKFDANLGAMRKSFREMGKLQQKSQKTRAQTIRAEKKHARQEMKRIKDTYKLKETTARKELDHVRRKKRETESSQRVEKRHTDAMARSHSQSRRKERDHVRGMNREMKRGPLGRVGRAMGKVGLFAGGGLLGLALGAALRGYRDYIAYQQSLGPTIGLGARAQTGIRQMRETYTGRWRRNKEGKRYRERVGSLGFNLDQTAALVPEMARATGVVNPLALMTGMRATGMGSGETAGILGALRQAGLGFAGPATVFQGGRERQMNLTDNRGKKAFEQMIAGGMYSGLEQARLPEFFKGVTTLLGQQQQLITGVVDPQGTTKLMGALGAFGRRIGAVGLQGTRGAQLMGTLGRAVLQPGGGPEGMAFMRQAMGYGRPGGVSLYEAEKGRERGLTKENFGRVMGELKRQWGTGQSAAWELRAMAPGLGLEQAEKLIRFSEEGQVNMEEVEKILEEAKPLELRAAEAMEKAATALTHIAGKHDRSIGRGAKAAKMIEEMEKAQEKVADWMIDKLPGILAAIKKALDTIAGILRDILAGMKAALKFLGIETVQDIKTLGEGVKDLALGKKDRPSLKESQKYYQYAYKGLLYGGKATREMTRAEAERMGHREYEARVLSGHTHFSAEQRYKKAWQADWLARFYNAAGIDVPTQAQRAWAEMHLKKAWEVSKDSPHQATKARGTAHMLGAAKIMRDRIAESRRVEEAKARAAAAQQAAASGGGGGGGGGEGGGGGGGGGSSSATITIDNKVSSANPGEGVGTGAKTQTKTVTVDSGGVVVDQ